jgi:transcriptional regulator with XRE-family HTH domain
MSDIDVKQIRADRGLTQKELADLAGVNLSTVWRWENGQPPRGTAKTFLLQLSAPTPSETRESA